MAQERAKGNAEGKKAIEESKNNVKTEGDSNSGAVQVGEIIPLTIAESSTKYLVV